MRPFRFFVNALLSRRLHAFKLVVIRAGPVPKNVELPAWRTDDDSAALGLAGERSYRHRGRCPDPDWRWGLGGWLAAIGVAKGSRLQPRQNNDQPWGECANYKR